ncbi:mandelate racemase/muconate lactonizing enzyme family protein [Amnibacterium sp.]|uniref:mandelate racemase/muconate lactonizing enzyme family protein n=1 Tax=Amnibacterium sp. TaxID=1872496 RepID=UPI002607A6F7|nr:mandelate racemase/muconate lactonizing enzyme family protein [Amnibacterium sp.]MCU1474766.1 racemase [Amnibacterium sp.]
MTAPTIERIEVRRIDVPLARAWAADVRAVSVLEVVLHDSDGGVGRGFSWTPSIGASAVAALLRDDIARFAVGRPAEPGPLWQAAWEHLHEAGGAGITTIALAGLDLALWDLAGRRADRPVADLLGRRAPGQPVYGSGVNLHYSQEELIEQAWRWTARGLTAAKIKVGRPDLAEDVDRVAAVREVLGPDRALMVDANQRWDLRRAIAAAEALRPFGLTWLEEPLRADDTAGYVALRCEAGIPIAQGENAHTIHRFRDLIDAGAVDVVQPNIVRVGGITPFLAIAALADQRGVEVAPHLLPELSAQLAVTRDRPTWVEDVEGARFDELDVLAAPTGLRVAHGLAVPGSRPGLGIAFA